jgi:hypothetical protein
MADRRYAEEARARELRVVVVMKQVYTQPQQALVIPNRAPSPVRNLLSLPR